MTRRILPYLILLVGVVLLFEYSGLDVKIQRLCYDFDTNRWLVDRNSGAARWIFYDGIKSVFVGFVMLVLMALTFGRNWKIVRDCRPGLLIVLFSAVTVPLVVNGIKAVSNVPCPKHLVVFNGDYPYVTLLNRKPRGTNELARVACYPAGHASGGFSLMSLTFLFKRKIFKSVAFSGAVMLGWVTGAYKMLIGDHFFGHTLVTMILSWIVILLVKEGVFRVSRRAGVPNATAGER